MRVRALLIAKRIIWPAPMPKNGNKKNKYPPFPIYFFGHVFSQLRRHGNSLIFWIGIAYCVHEMAVTLQAFAGRTSLANLGLSIFANLSVAWTINFTVSGISIALYLRERAVHRKTRERLTSRIKVIELKVDPTRTSSHLTSKGLTQKEDE